MQKVVVLGAGESGVGSALLAKHKGYDVFVSDKGNITDKSKAELITYDIPFESGEHTQERIMQADVVVKSPGIPDHIPLIQALLEQNIPVISEIEWGYRFCEAKIIAITGSNGKTTTTALTYHLMSSLGDKVAVGGNYGVSFARLLVEKPETEVFVLEISSFQLDGIVDFCPDIAVILNITEDHLDRYNYSVQQYAESKWRITKNQSSEDYLLLNQNDQNIAQLINAKATFAQTIYVDEVNVLSKLSYGLEDYTVTSAFLNAKHNRFNAQCAINIASLIGLSKPDIQARLNDFVGLPHRMEVCRVLDGITYINDSKATNVDAVEKAIDSLASPIVWIAGGVDKGNDYGKLIQVVSKKVPLLICLGEDNGKLIAAFEGVIAQIKQTTNIEEAVRWAKASATESSYVLLSPACASFDLFKNYMDRGEQFKKVVAEL